MLLPNLPPPTEGVFHTEQDVDCYVKNRCLGSGTLYIAQSRLSWAKHDSEEGGLSLEYPHISIHAISHDTSQFHKPCIYLMLDCVLFPEDDSDPSESESDGDGDGDGGGGGGGFGFVNDPEPKFTEVRFTAQSVDSLPIIYKAISDCQILHPPEEQESDHEPPAYDEEEEGEYDVEQDDDVDVALPPHYEQHMENGLGEVVAMNGNSAAGGRRDAEEPMDDEDQFRDA